jgi:hypothetical protein
MSVLTKEQPTVQKFPVDWNSAPEWAYFWAMDSTGTAYFYEEEPELNVDKGYFHSYVGYQERYPYKIPGWEISLQQRSMRPHPHAALMAKYAEVAARRTDPWFEFQYTCATNNWLRLNDHPTWDESIKYRHIGEDSSK